VFLSSHILQDIEMICDRVAILVDGRIVNQGPLFELISEKILFTEMTLSGMPEGELRAYGDCLTTQGGKVLLKVFEEAKVQEVLRLAMERNAVVHSLVPRSESLEDLFVGTVRSR
jgi:ABC-2 type transport system ATP-binding protein